jgi:hypothetical protein
LFQHKLEGIDFFIKTYNQPLIYAFTQNLDKANPRCHRQVHLSVQQADISPLRLENSIAGALSRLYHINMPASLEAREFQGEPENTSELKSVIDESITSLKLKNLSTYLRRRSTMTFLRAE